MFSRSTQVHHVYLASHVTVYDRAYQWWMSGSSAMGHMKEQGQALLYGVLNREATMLAFSDVFLYLTIISIAVFPLIFFMKTTKLDGEKPTDLK